MRKPGTHVGKRNARKGLRIKDLLPRKTVPCLRRNQVLKHELSRFLRGRLRKRRILTRGICIKRIRARFQPSLRDLHGRSRRAKFRVDERHIRHDAVIHRSPGVLLRRAANLRKRRCLRRAAAKGWDRRKARLPPEIRQAERKVQIRKRGFGIFI